MYRYSREFLAEGASNESGNRKSNFWQYIRFLRVFARIPRGTSNENLAFRNGLISISILVSGIF